MPVIVMASPKGGTGKTTCAVLLATGFARMGASVTILDCDPSRGLTIWADNGLPNNVSHGGHPGPSEIVTAIRSADGDGCIVIVDLEGVATRTVSRAISQADLVIVPMQATALDATVGSGAIALIREEEKTLGRQINHSVVLTRTTAAMKSRVQRDLEKQLADSGIDRIEPSLVHRAAYGELFTFGGDLETMAANEDVTTGGRIDRAIDNAQAFTEAVYVRIANR